MDAAYSPDGSLARLVAVMARLRNPQDGCPWDVEQTFESIAPHTIEEAYEVADAIAQGDMDHLREELGDLLLQVIFHSRMAEEAGAFDLGQVMDTLHTKLVSRHPHVFGTAEVADAAEQTHAWEALKDAERAEREDASALAGVALGLPALLRAHKLQKRAARVGFDWPDARGPLDKIHEEAAELAEALDRHQPRAAVEAELGDLLFSVVNLARKLDLDPETALRHANGRFERRFRHMEAALADRGDTMAETPLADLEPLWRAAKMREEEIP